jgi:hypothetical protein
LGALTISEQWQSFAGDKCLEMITFLVSSKGGFVREKFIEEKMGAIVLTASDQKQLNARLLLRLGQEAVENAGYIVVLARFRLPLGDDQKSASALQGIGVCGLHEFTPLISRNGFRSLLTTARTLVASLATVVILGPNLLSA